MTAQERLKLVRDIQGHTQKEIAVLLGISPRTWQDYEGGINVPGWKVLEGLSKMGFNVNWILAEIGEMRLANSDLKKMEYDEAVEKLRIWLKENQNEAQNIKEQLQIDNLVSPVRIETFILKKDTLSNGDYVPDACSLLEILKLTPMANNEEFINAINFGKEIKLNNKHNQIAKSLSETKLITPDSLDKDYKLIRDIIEVYESKLANRDEQESIQKKARNIVNIYRYVKEHPEKIWTNDEISNYIDEWH